MWVYVYANGLYCSIDVVQGFKSKQLTYIIFWTHKGIENKDDLGLHPGTVFINTEVFPLFLEQHSQVP